MNPTMQLQRARASHAEEDYRGPTRGWRTVDDAERPAPYVKASLKFRMAIRGFGMLPIPKTEMATCSAESHPKLVMTRGFARPFVTPVDKLYTYAHQQFDETFLRHIELGNNAQVSSMLQNVSCVHQLADSTKTTLLHFAAQYGNQDFAQSLINLGATVDARNLHCETPLMYAVKAGQEATVDLLLKYNADILLPGFRYCALGKALGNRQNVSKNIVKALLNSVTIESLNASAYVKTKQFHDTCQLYHFISLRNAKLTRILLEKGSPVDAKSQVGETALHLAAQQLDLEHVKLLLEFGADVNAQKADGRTPVTCIESFEDQNRALAIVKVLVAAGATLIDCSSLKMMEWPLLMEGNREVVRAALQCPIDLHSRNGIGKAPLHYIAKNRHAGVFEELRVFDFDANVRGASDATLLHYAASVGNLSSVKFLLDSGIDVDARDEFDYTPLIFAVRRGMYCKSVDDYLRCIEALLDHGASPRLVSLSEFAHFPSVADKFSRLAKPVVAHSALLEASGRAIKAAAMTVIESCSAFKANFELAKLQLKELKEVRIFKSVTLLDILIGSDATISMYARNARLVLNLSHAMKECNSGSYYHRRLSTRFVKLTHLAEMRKSVTVVVNEVLSQIYDLNVENVAQNIVNYVADRELYRMLPIPK